MCILILGLKGLKGVKGLKVKKGDKGVITRGWIKGYQGVCYIMIPDQGL